jgi:hypothetical protein
VNTPSIASDAMLDIRRLAFCFMFFYAITVQAQLVVTILPTKIVGQKALVELKMKNKLSEKVESARAICFLLDEQGKMVGQSTKWVIGGTKDRPALEPKGETAFNFVITNPQPFTTTNLTAKVSFSRVVLEGGKLANATKDVSMIGPAQH